MTLEDKFTVFNQENPKVYELFKDFALRAIKTALARNQKYLSADMIMHRIRWETLVETTDDTYRINNNWVANYSRMFQKEFAEYSHFFKNRKTQTEKEKETWY